MTVSLVKIHYKKTLRKDLTSRFFYKNSNTISELKTIHLNIGIKDVSFKSILPNFLGLEFLSSNFPYITKAKKNIHFLNIKKRSPNGVKVTLTKNSAYNFFQKLIFRIIPNFQKRKNKILVTNKNSISFSTKEIDSLHELTLFYNLFKTLSLIDITINSTTLSLEEFVFFLTSFKFPTWYLRK